MKKFFLLLAVTSNLAIFAQNVGIGTTNPTNTLHVSPTGNVNPIRIDGLQNFSTEKNLLVVDPASGVIKHIHIDSIINMVIDSVSTGGSDDQNIDSLTLNGTILTAYIENGLSANIDLSNLQDGTGTDDQNIDSLTLNGTILTAYIENGLSANIDLSTLQDGTGTDDQNIDSLVLNGTILSTFIENGTPANIDLQPIIDSALANIPSGGDDNDWNINGNGSGLEAAPAGDNLASGNHAISAGRTDSVSGHYSTIAGGRSNKVLGSYSFIGGGNSNIIQNDYSVLGGGYLDSVYASFAGVFSGRLNYVDGSYSAILGGWGNKLHGTYSTISGGYLNYTSGSSNSVTGHTDTVYNSFYSAIFGGRLNKVSNSGESGIFAGAENNTDNSNFSVILGGQQNKMTRIGNSYVTRSAIVAGSYNIMKGDTNSVTSDEYTGWSGIYSGIIDTVEASKTAIIIGAEESRISNGYGAGIYSGIDNKIDSTVFSSLVGGRDNSIFGGEYSSLIGGNLNTISSSTGTIILGGTNNTANNFAQVVLGHHSSNNIPIGASTTAIAPENILFKIGNGANSSNLNDAVRVYGSGITFIDSALGIGTIAPSEKLTVDNGTSIGTYTATGWAHSSDKRLKTNIKPVKNALHIVSQLNGVYYNWVQNKNGDRQIGFIAQDVKNILPEVVTGTEGSIEKGETLGMVYQNITPVIIEAMKEQQKLIELQKEEISILKKEIEEIKKEIKNK